MMALTDEQIEGIALMARNDRNGGFAALLSVIAVNFTCDMEAAIARGCDKRDEMSGRAQAWLEMTDMLEGVVKLYEARVERSREMESEQHEALGVDQEPWMPGGMTAFR